MHWGVFNWLLFLLLAVTFGVLWLRRNTQPTQWAAYPAAGFLALAIMSFIMGEKFQQYWLSTVMLIIAGMLVVALFNRKIPAAGPQTPQIKV
jgi:ABC-type transport system involved in cytochrome c biogenesis permease subunit